MPKIHVIDVEDRWDHNNEDEFLWWPRVMWLDPGTVTGVSIIWFDPKAVFEGKTTARQILAHSDTYLHGPETGPNGQVNRALRMHRTLHQEIGLATGVERFTVREINNDYEFLSPTRIGASYEFALSLRRPVGEESVGNGVPVFYQEPVDAKKTFTNDRLRALGLYQPGPDHINDARRHALLWIRKLRTRGLEFFREAHGHEEGWWE